MRFLFSKQVQRFTNEDRISCGLNQIHGAGFKESSVFEESSEIRETFGKVSLLSTVQTSPKQRCRWRVRNSISQRTQPQALSVRPKRGFARDRRERSCKAYRKRWVSTDRNIHALVKLNTSAARARIGPRRSHLNRPEARIFAWVSRRHKSSRTCRPRGATGRLATLSQPRRNSRTVFGKRSLNLVNVLSRGPCFQDSRIIPGIIET